MRYAQSYYLGIVLVFLSLQPAIAATLNLAIQPVLPKQQIEIAYRPLASYLSQATGHTVNIRASENFLAYWETVRNGKDIQLTLDAAHFTDFRVKRMHYTVLAKIPDTVSMSLVTGEDLLLFEPNELIGMRVATIASPSLSGVRLSQLYPNPLRQPTVVGTNDFVEALQKLKSGKVRAALVPTPLIRGDASVNTVLTTEPVPHMALSASPEVDATTQNKIKRALLDAHKTEAGKAMLEKINFSTFENASNATYNGYSKLLEGVWGY